MQKNIYILAAVVVFIMAGGALVIHLRAKAPIRNSNLQATSTSNMGTTTVDLGNGETAILPPGVTLTEVDTPAMGIQAPNLDKLNQSVTYSANLPADAVATIKTDIATLTTSLKANPSQGDKWLALGVYYKMAGDYSAAESVWTYITQVSPSSYIAFFNLGDLYQSFKVNYQKAEANYLQVIKLKPDYIDAYVNLFYIYHGFYKTNTSAAADIVAQGLKANPNNPDLLQLQKQLQAR